MEKFREQRIGETFKGYNEEKDAFYLEQSAALEQQIGELKEELAQEEAQKNLLQRIFDGIKSLAESFEQIKQDIESVKKEAETQQEQSKEELSKIIKYIEDNNIVFAKNLEEIREQALKAEEQTTVQTEEAPTVSEESMETPVQDMESAPQSEVVEQQEEIKPEVPTFEGFTNPEPVQEEVEAPKEEQVQDEVTPSETQEDIPVVEESNDLNQTLEAMFTEEPQAETTQPQENTQTEEDKKEDGYIVLSAGFIQASSSASASLKEGTVRKEVPDVKNMNIDSMKGNIATARVNQEATPIVQETNGLTL